MGMRKGVPLHGLCLNWIRPHFGRSPPIQQARPPPSNDTAAAASSDGGDSSTMRADDGGDTADHRNGTAENSDSSEQKLPTDNHEAAKSRTVSGKKIMIVGDSSIEAKVAVRWALSHTVQSQDTVILLHVTKLATKRGDESIKEIVPPRVYELLYTLKSMCHLKRPEVRLQIEVAAAAEGKDRGRTILEQAKKQGVAMLVLGDRRRSTTRRLFMIWAGHRVSGRGSLVDYCIQNAECMAIAVRQKSKKQGGYLITTKRHKDFWLLA